MCFKPGRQACVEADRRTDGWKLLSLKSQPVLLSVSVFVYQPWNDLFLLSSHLNPCCTDTALYQQIKEAQHDTLMQDVCFLYEKNNLNLRKYAFMKWWLNILSIPSSSPLRALVFIAHGAGEHCGPYDEIAQRLKELSLLVFAHDHGESQTHTLHRINSCIHLHLHPWLSWYSHQGFTR